MNITINTFEDKELIGQLFEQIFPGFGEGGKSMKIIIDAFGGDNAPAAVLEGCAQAVRELAQNSQLYLVARVQCFRDPLMASGWVGSLMTRGGNLWHDAQGVGWSSPASQQAVDYLSALCLELAEMGFDEIVLEEFYFPIGGKLDTIRRARAIIEQYNPACELEVDGGIAPGTAEKVIEAGANVLVAGSAVYGAEDPARAIELLRTAR